MQQSGDEQFEAKQIGTTGELSCTDEKQNSVDTGATHATECRKVDRIRGRLRAWTSQSKFWSADYQCSHAVQIAEKPNASSTEPTAGDDAGHL